MLQAVRRQFSTTTILIVVVLVFVLSGGAAYAAKRYLITSTSQISPSVLKKLKGSAGSKGASGAPGPQGAQGPSGGPGPQGAQGPSGAASQGEKGSQGSAGPPGEKGVEGKQGPAGPFVETLPKGAQETGTWVAPSAAIAVEFGAISFTFPLAAGLDESHVEYVTLADVEGNKIPTGCAGSAEEPQAEGGFLCVFEGNTSSPVGGAERATIKKPEPAFAAGTGTSGAILEIEQATAGAWFSGSWAVRGA